MKTFQTLTKRLAPIVASAGLSASCLLAGCNEIEKEYPAPKQEKARVSQKIHEGFYLESKNARIKEHPERYLITFDGKVDFTVDNLELYNKFNSNDVANVTYKEEYDPKRFTLIGYKFLDAQPITNQITRGIN